MTSTLPNYIRSNRKRCLLTQADLAQLFGLCSQGQISQYEAVLKRPTIEVLIASRVIFGVPCRNIFPQIYSEIEGSVLMRIKLLRDEIAARGGDKNKVNYLTEIIYRIEHLPDV